MKGMIKILGIIYGYGIMICLFAGGLTFFGYVAALIVGGDMAETICHVIYKQITPIIIYVSTSMVVLGLVKMYLSGEVALTIQSNKKKAKAKKETKAKKTES